MPAAACSFLSACSDTDDTQAPQVSIQELTPYQAVKGTFAVTVDAQDNDTVDKVELVAVGDKATILATAKSKPYTIQWDTTDTQDGLIDVIVRAHDGAGNTADSAPVTLIVANHGLVVLDDSITLSPQEGAENHVRGGYSIAGGVHRILAVVQGPAAMADWDIKVDVGTGNCPHSGVSLANIFSEEDSAAPVVLEYADEAGNELTPGSYFVHIGAQDEADHYGDTIELLRKVVLFE